MTARPRCARTALVTARSAPAHERAIRTLMDWNIEVDEAMFLGGLPRGASSCASSRPDFFFDDQTGHIRSAARHVPASHVPAACATAERHPSGEGWPGGRPAGTMRVPTESAACVSSRNSPPSAPSRARPRLGHAPFPLRGKVEGAPCFASIIVLNLAAVYMLVLINDWNRLFYDALQNKQQDVFWTQLGRFTWIAFAYIIIAVYKFYLTQLLGCAGAPGSRPLHHPMAGRPRLLPDGAEPLHAARGGRKTGSRPTTRTSAFQEDLNLFTSYSVS